MSWLIRSLQGRMIAVTSGSLLAVSIVGGLLGLWGQARTFAETERLLLDTQVKVIDRLIAARLQEMAKVTEGFIRPLEIQDALAARNADNLMENARPPFNRLSGQAGLTHLAYYDASGSRLLALPKIDDASLGRGVEAVVADKKSVRGVDRVNGEPILVVLQPVYRRGEFVGVVQVGTMLRRLAPELSQTLNAQGAVLVASPGPSDAVAFHDMVLVGVSDEFRGLLASLRTLPSMDQASIQTLTTKGSAHVVTFHPLRSPDGMVQGAMVLAGDVTAAVSFMKRTLLLLVVFTAVTSAGAILFTSVLLSRRLRPLSKTVEVLREIAQGEGDLTRRLESKGSDEIDELARSFNTFMDKLHDIVGQVKQTALDVASASQEVSAASERLSAGTQEEASSLEETAASLEEITGTVSQNAASARHASELAVGSRKTAQNGRQVVSSAVASMADITRASQRIGEIITVIDEIAFQTNLLALNAAVEAARAGEQGRGFAVVAAEVRSLAQRSAAAAKETKALIQDSVQKVESGSALVSRSGATLEEIVTSVNRVTGIIAEIAAASQEQSQGMEQVNRAVTQMDRSVQQNATHAEELSSTAQALAAQAARLEALVGRFELTEGADVHRPVGGLTRRRTRNEGRDFDAPPSPISFGATSRR